MTRASFGLTSDYIKNVYEQFFFLKYHAQWSLQELYNLPVGLRKWFLQRTIKQKEEEHKQHEKAVKEASSRSR